MSKASLGLKRRVRSFVSIGLVLGLGFAYAAAAATATGAARFGGEGEAAGQFQSPAGIAVTQETGAVYMVDSRNERVERWTPAGEFVSAWGWGVEDRLAESFQICTTACFAGLSGTGSGEFGERPEGVAVDNSLGSAHDVYVVDPRNLRVQEFAPSGEFLRMFGGEVNTNTHDVCGAGEKCQAGVSGVAPGEFSALGGEAVAVDESGDVYVGDANRVEVFSGTTGAFVREVSLPGVGFVSGLAVDGTGDLYVVASELNGVHKYDPTGVELGAPRDSEGHHGREIAIGEADDLFVYDGEKAHLFEYDPSGAQLLSIHEANADGGIAVNRAEGTVDVVHPQFVQRLKLPEPGPFVLAESEEATEVSPTSAGLKAQINPEGGSETTARFEYGTSTAYGTTTAAEPLSGEVFEDQTASAQIEGLAPNTVYHFRVVATNGAAQTAIGVDQTFKTAPATSIDGLSVSHVTTTSVQFVAQLNPHGQQAEYTFEYGTTPAYGKSAPAHAGLTTAASTDETVEVLATGLEPGTEYHFRVITHNAFGNTDSEDRTFTTQGTEAQGLLDGRQLEQVSPQDKHGVSLESLSLEGGIIQAAESGGAITYFAKGPITSEPAGNRSIADQQLLASRMHDGWSTTDITTPHEEVVGLSVGVLSEYKAFSGDLKSALVEPFGATPLSELATERTPYRREANGEYVPLIYPGNVPPGTKFGGEDKITPGLFEHDVTALDMTPDAQHVVVRSPTPLTTGVGSTPEENLYEWNNGALKLVSVLPTGQPAGELGVQVELGDEDSQVRNAISNNGNRIFFSVGPNLYVRDVEREETLQLDTIRPGARGGEAGSAVARFRIASVTGDRVYFTDGVRLTVGSDARASVPDLYRCDLGIAGGHLACALKDVTPALNPADPAHVHGDVLGADEGGNRVYFVASGALTPGAVEGQCQDGTPNLSETQCNLYMYDAGAESLTLIAVLSSIDDPDWGGGNTGADGQQLGNMTSRVSSSGQFLAFMSREPLTGYDNLDAATGVRDEEVFEYNSSTNAISCVSCSATSERPTGLFVEESAFIPGPLVDRPQNWANRTLAGSIPGWTKVDLPHAFYQSRYLSNDGRLFFNSPVDLVPADANGEEDVYEYEPSEVGSCRAANGCVALLSGGASGEESAFVDASQSGNDAFLISAAQLAATDTDQALDIYDAHVCSEGEPCFAPAPAPPQPCGSTDSCRPAPQPQLVIATPPTSGAIGNGNVAPGRVQANAPKQLTRAQLLKRAMNVCKKKPKRKRASCVADAKRRYGPRKAHPSRRAARHGRSR